jgi:hypothetical protein
MYNESYTDASGNKIKFTWHISEQACQYQHSSKFTWHISEQACQYQHSSKFVQWFLGDTRGRTAFKPRLCTIHNILEHSE